MNKNQHGFSLVGILLILMVIGAIGFAAWRVTQSNNDTSSDTKTSSVNSGDSTKSETGPYIVWDYMGGEKWGGFRPQSTQVS